MAETEPVVLVGIEERIATMTLNRPQARNALSREVTHALWDAVAGAGDDPGVDAVILTGEGYMAETWQAGVSHVAERRAGVTARGRAQTS